MEACKCDACGKYYKYDVKEAVKQFSLMGRRGYSVTEERYPDSRSRKLDICPDCQYQLWKMFNQEEKSMTRNDANAFYELPNPPTLTTAGEPMAFFGPTGVGTMWHKYPDEKPPEEDMPYLITCEYLWGEDRFVMEAFWGDVEGTTLWFEIDSRGNDMPLTLKVFAWAEMPEPYKEN
jgi:hypothetical protein